MHSQMNAMENSVMGMVGQPPMNVMSVTSNYGEMTPDMMNQYNMMQDPNAWNYTMQADPSVAPQMSSGMTNFNAYELAYYKNLWSIVDSQNAGYIDGNIGREFLKKSGLPDPILREVWNITDATGSGMLNMYGFYCACRLVAHVQAGLLLSPEAVNIEPSSLPHFDVPLESKAPEVYGFDAYGNPVDVSNVPYGMDQAVGMNNFVSSPANANAAGLYSSTPAAYGTVYPSPAAALYTSTPGMGGEEVGEALSKPVNWNDMMEELPSIAVEEFDWSIPVSYQLKYRHLFRMHDLSMTGYIHGNDAKQFLSKSGLSQNELMLIWEMADQDKDGQLNLSEFAVAVHLINCRRKGMPIPDVLPKALTLIINNGLAAKSKGAEKESPKAVESAAKRMISEEKKKPEAIYKTLEPKYSSYAHTLAADNMKQFNASVSQIEHANTEAVPISIMKGMVEGDKRITKSVALDVDAMSMELEDISAAADVLKNEIVAERLQIARQLERKKESYKLLEEERRNLANLQEERRQCELDRVAGARDLKHYDDEVQYLRRVAAEAASDMKLLLASNLALEREHNKTERYVATLDGARKGVASALRNERALLEEEEKEIAELKNSLERMRRDKEEAQARNAMLQERLRQADQDRMLLMTSIESERAKLIVTKDNRIRLAADRNKLAQEMAAVAQQAWMQEPPKTAAYFSMGGTAVGSNRAQNVDGKSLNPPNTNIGYGLPRDAKGVPAHSTYTPPNFYSYKPTRSPEMEGNWTSFGADKNAYVESVAASRMKSKASSRGGSVVNANAAVSGLEAIDSVSAYDERASNNGRGKGGSSIFFKGKEGNAVDDVFDGFTDFNEGVADDEWKKLNLRDDGMSMDPFAFDNPKH